MQAKAMRMYRVVGSTAGRARFGRTMAGTLILSVPSTRKPITVQLELVGCVVVGLV